MLVHVLDVFVHVGVDQYCIILRFPLMLAGIRFYPRTHAGSFKSSLLLGLFVPAQPRMSATAAEPAASEPQASPAAPDTSATTPAPAALPDDPVVSGVLSRFIRQYETKDTAEQVRTQHSTVNKALRGILAALVPNKMLRTSVMLFGS